MGEYITSFFFIFTVRIMLISGSAYVMLFVERIEPTKHASSNKFFILENSINNITINLLVTNAWW